MTMVRTAIWSLDREIEPFVCAWSGSDGTHLRTLQWDDSDVYTLAVGRDGRLFVGGGSGAVRVWRAMGSASRCVVLRASGLGTSALCLDAAGTLYTALELGDEDQDEDADEEHVKAVIEMW
jgi:hypothetical protein